MSSADVADPEVLEVAWDLDPLLEGDPSDPVAAVDAMLAEAQRAPTRSPSATPATSASSTAPASSRRCASSATLQEIVARAGSFSGLHFSTDTADPARGALFQRVQEKATPIETKLLFFELEWAALDDDARRRAARHRRPRLLPPPPAHGPPLPALPALRARGEDPRREGADLPQRLGPAVRGAGRRARGRRSRTAPSPSRSRSRSRTCTRPTATARAHAAERVTAALAPGLRTRGFVFNTLLADKMVDDRLRGYPHWLASRNLANEASDESVAGARHRGPQPLRAAAPLVPAEGAAARPRPARGLRPHGGGHRREPGRRAGARRATSCRTPTRTSRPCSATSSAASSTSAGSTRRCAPASARARSAPTRCRPCTRT